MSDRQTSDRTPDQTPDQTWETVLVIGATGRTGRPLVDGLLARGVTVRALVRNPRTADLPDQVLITEGAVEDAGALASAAGGADAAFLLWPHIEGLEPTEVVDTVAGAGVRHLVYLSSATRDGGVTDGIYAAVEQAVEDSGLSWTFVRPGGFAGNTQEWVEQIQAGDLVRTPFPDAGRALIDERDIAEVAVHALLDPALTGKAITISGPEVLTMRQQVQTIGRALGRDLRVETQPRAEAEQFYRELMGPDFARQAMTHWASLVDDPEPVFDGVRTVTGHPPRSFATWATDHVQLFR